MGVKQQGFSLVELLVAIGILGIVGSIATVILFTTLQSASKSDILREVKQNGDYAISVMERMVRNATTVEVGCPVGGGTLTGTSLRIKNPDERTTTFRAEASESVTKIASTGGMLTNNKVSASNLSFICTRTPGKPDVVSQEHLLVLKSGLQ
ncbi:MAG: Uncharacterized protein LiPW16_370 [Microgenomates group bacterium LiPW_16]|nr:MAG: Uncharacterized protein LiPW16_370 [Microgenomates group bacterium LiPW_16]